MGNCQPGGYPRKITLDELKDLKIGDIYESTQGCGPNISGTQPGSGYQQLIDKGFGWPNNGEFSWGGLGSSCSLCSNVPSYGCDCSEGRGASISGSRGTIKRVAYKGDPLNCCLSRSRLDGDFTCDPKYSDYSSGACDGPMLGYCVGENMKDGRCLNYCNENPDKCRANLISYCGEGDNLSTDFCKSFVRSNVGPADTIVINYCSRHPEDKDFCGCLNIPDDIKKLTQSGIGVKPQCNVAQCVSATAYKTQSMMNDKVCPVLNLCEQNLNITSATKAVLSNISFSCVQNTNTTPGSTQSQPASAPKVVAETPLQPKTKLQEIINNNPKLTPTVIGLLIAVIIAILLCISSGIVAVS